MCESFSEIFRQFLKNQWAVADLCKPWKKSRFRTMLRFMCLEVTIVLVFHFTGTSFLAVQNCKITKVNTQNSRNLSSCSFNLYPFNSLRSRSEMRHMIITSANFLRKRVNPTVRPLKYTISEIMFLIFLFFYK